MVTKLLIFVILLILHCEYISSIILYNIFENQVENQSQKHAMTTFTDSHKNWSFHFYWFIVFCLQCSHLIPIWPFKTGISESENSIIWLNAWKIWVLHHWYSWIAGNLISKGVNVHNCPKKWLIFMNVFISEKRPKKSIFEHFSQFPWFDTQI